MTPEDFTEACDKLDGELKESYEFVECELDGKKLYSRDGDEEVGVSFKNEEGNTITHGTQSFESYEMEAGWVELHSEGTEMRIFPDGDVDIIEK